MTTTVRWRKASYSTEGANCVEVASTLDRLRDSKNPTGPVLSANVETLIQAVRSDNFSQVLMDRR